MSNDIIIPNDFGVVPDSLKNLPVDPSTWSAGIGMAWPILTLKGKEWGWRFRGESYTYTAPNAQAGGAVMPIQVLEVVLIKPALRISKVYYQEGYKDGERTPPTCWSADGITPDQGVSEKQSATCRGCRHNVMVVGQNGARGKACSDNKRVAVVTTADLANTDFGGPFMLRLPPGSFANYTNYTSVMNSRGYQPYQIVTRLRFDSTPHPKVMFSPARVLTAAEGELVAQHFHNPRMDEMLNDKAEGAFADVETDPVTGEVGKLPDASANPTGWTPTVVPKEPVQPVKTLPPQDVQTPEQAEIAKLKAQLAAAEKAAEPEPEPAPVLTPEQLEIQALKAKLAEAGSKPRGRPRTKPVGPPTETVTASSNGATPAPVPAGDLDNDIANRVASLVKKAE